MEPSTRRSSSSTSSTRSVERGPPAPRLAPSLAPVREPHVTARPSGYVTRERIAWGFYLSPRAEHRPGLAMWPLSLVLFIGFFWGATRVAGKRRARSEQAAAAARTPCEVRRLSLAFDWTRRLEIQQALRDESGRHDLSTVAGLGRFSRRVTRLLVKHAEAARYGAWQRFYLSARAAEVKVVALEHDMASRYQDDLVHGDERAPVPDIRPRREDGAGLVVVSLVIGSTVRLPPLPESVEGASVEQVLKSSLPAADEELVAFHVIWSPAADADRMSSAELEMLYPELLKLDSHAALGRTNCSFCRAVYARELSGCPACGAPAE